MPNRIFNSIQEAIRVVNNIDRTVNPDAPSFQDGTLLEINDNVNAIIVVGNIAYQREVAPFGPLLPKVSEIPNAIHRSLAAYSLVCFYQEKSEEAAVNRYRAKRDKVYRDIAAMLGADATYDDKEDLLFVNGHPIYDLELNEGFTRTRARPWYGHLNGKVVVTVYTDRCYRFPEKKDGSRDFTKIVSLVRMIADRNEMDRKLGAIENKNASIITDELCVDLKPIDRRNIIPTQIEEKPICINYEISGTVTVKIAKAIAKKLREIRKLLKGE